MCIICIVGCFACFCKILININININTTQSSFNEPDLSRIWARVRERVRHHKQLQSAHPPLVCKSGTDVVRPTGTLSLASAGSEAETQALRTAFTRDRLKHVSLEGSPRASVIISLSVVHQHKVKGQSEPSESSSHSCYCNGIQG